MGILRVLTLLSCKQPPTIHRQSIRTQWADGGGAGQMEVGRGGWRWVGMWDKHAFGLSIDANSHRQFFTVRCCEGGLGH